jgi:hypothetical protein
MVTSGTPCALACAMKKRMLRTLTVKELQQVAGAADPPPPPPTGQSSGKRQHGEVRI